MNWITCTFNPVLSQEFLPVSDAIATVMKDHPEYCVLIRLYDSLSGARATALLKEDEYFKLMEILSLKRFGVAVPDQTFVINAKTLQKKLATCTTKDLAEDVWKIIGFFTRSQSLHATIETLFAKPQVFKQPQEDSYLIYNYTDLNSAPSPKFLASQSWISKLPKRLIAK